MRALIQRVLRSSVRVENELISSIERGLSVLIGIQSDDDQTDLEYIVKKILTTKLWPNGDKQWAQSVVDLDLSILCISQFTLHALTVKGSKPDFHLAMSAEQSKQMYQQLIDKLKQEYKQERIFDGRFGDYMTVNIENDGPVTILIDSKVKKPLVQGKNSEKESAAASTTD